MKHDCSCQGLNENCFKCSGRGYYNDKDLHNTFPAVPHRTLSPPIRVKRDKRTLVAKKVRQIKAHSVNIDNKKKDTLIRCPWCGCSVKKDRIEKHYRIVHHSNFVINIPISRSKTNTSIKSDRLQSLVKTHFDVVSTNSNNQLMPVGTKQSIPLNRKPLKILQNKIVTGKESNDNSLSATIAERRMITSLNKKGGRDKRKIDLNKDIKKTRIIDTGIVEKKINSDGSKDWYTFRERGKYGSHPSFDPMDDESLP